MSCYGNLPKLIEEGIETGKKFGVRVTVYGMKNPRCGLWHYFALPILPVPEAKKLCDCDAFSAPHPKRWCGS